MNHEFYDVHDVNVAISNKLVHSFADIPEHLQSYDVAEEWFVSMITVKKKPLEDCLSEVPPKLWTAEFLTTVANSGCNLLRYIDPGRDPLYLSIGMMCVRRNYKNLADLDPKYRTEFAKTLAVNNTYDIHLIAKEFPWVRDHIADNDATRCCLNIDFALGYAVLPDDVGRRIMANGDGFDKIRAHGRLDLLAEQISAGEWPRRILNSNSPMPKPISLEAGIHWLSQLPPVSSVQALYMAYAMTHPMDQVVPMMCENKLARMVLEMYSKEELAPYVKQYRVLRGGMLEEALGL